MNREESRSAVRQRPEALQVLLDSSAMLLASDSRDAVLGEILDLASSMIAADAYAVWGNADAYSPWRVLASRGLSDGYPKVLAAPAITDLKLMLVENVLAEPSLGALHERYEAEGIRSMMVVPLELRKTSSGTITFYWKSSHPFTDRDTDYAKALGNLAAAALANSELHEQAGLEKQRLTFLAEASTILSSSLDYETTLQQVARLVVPKIADWCTVHMLENGTWNRLVTAHADPAMLEMAREFSSKYPEEIREDRGLGALPRTMQSEVYADIAPEMVDVAARDEEHRLLLRSLNITSSILVPLVSRNRLLGAIRLLAAGSGRHFSPEDVQLAEDLARRAASSIENAQLHREVLKHESQLRLSQAAARMGSWTAEPDDACMYWSKELRDLIGWDGGEEVDTDRALELVHADDRDRIVRELEQVFKSGDDQFALDHRVVNAAGAVQWIHSRGSVHRSDSGAVKQVVGISMDVTDWRRAEDALRRTEKLAAAGRLAATVAHEVNNPLEALTNLVFLAGHTDGVPEAARRYLQTAEGELNRMAHIVRQTLGFYRESVQPKPVDLRSVAADVMDLYRSRAEVRHIHLELNPGSAVMAMANAGELKQVVANLLSNAIDASHEGGTVRLRVAAAGLCAEIVVEDEGTGIDPAVRGRLFEPFFTTKQDVGTGLGLWVSKEIVEKHEGKLRVDSKADSGSTGTTFVVELPLLAARA